MAAIVENSANSITLNGNQGAAEGIPNDGTGEKHGTLRLCLSIC